MDLFDQIQIVRENIERALSGAKRNKSVTIIAATKTQNSSTVEKCISAGILHIGENRIQEAVNKFKKIQTKENVYTRRMIGHLQSNKINKALSYFDTIDSVDTLSLAKKIAVKSEERKTKTQIMLEINTSQEQSKFGFHPEDEQGLLETIELNNIKITGLMTLGPRTKEQKETEKAFTILRKTKERLNNQLPNDKNLTELSMGMSGDYEIAVKEGSTMVRLGTALFGRRV